MCEISAKPFPKIHKDDYYMDCSSSSCDPKDIYFNRGFGMVRDLVLLTLERNYLLISVFWCVEFNDSW